MGEIRRSGGKATFYMADFSSLDEVRDLAAAVRRDHARLDLLINNAGIGTSSGGDRRRTSADGHELRFAVNYLAGFLLTHLLLPLLRAGAPARVVNVASAGQAPIDFSDVMLEKGYDGVQAYCQSKLAQIMFMLDLADELDGTGVTVNALHPATYMDTTMVRRAGIRPLSSVEEGAEASSISRPRPRSKGGAAFTSTDSGKRVPTGRRMTQRRASASGRSALT